MTRVARTTGAALLAALAAGGCGSGGGSGAAKRNAAGTSPAQRGNSTPSTPAPRRPKGAHGADPARLRVVRAWVTAETQGRMAKAASYFALPALVANPQPLRLRTRAQVRGFNEALPCGAKLTDAYEARHVVVATFTLVRRPGADCGAGVGGSASTAFVIRNGKIAQWLRVPDQTGGAAPSPRSNGPAQPLAPPQTATGSSGPAGPAI